MATASTRARTLLLLAAIVLGACTDTDVCSTNTPPPPPTPTAEDFPTRFPLRAADLADGELLSIGGLHPGDPRCSGGGCSHDITGARWDDDDGNWTSLRASTDGDEPDSEIVFGLPVYTVADGEVIACWRNYPDHPFADENPYECACNTNTAESSCDIDADQDASDAWVSCPSVMRHGGNAVVTRAPDGTSVTYNHLQTGSIPLELCPKNPTAAFPTDAAAVGSEGFPQEYVPEIPRPQVRVGDFLGRVGHNGSSDHPHLHFEANVMDPIDDNFRERVSLETFIDEAWYRERCDADREWTPLVGEPLNPILTALGAILLWPDAEPP